MIKKTSSIISVLVLLGIALAACTSAAGTTGLGDTPGVFGNSASTQVASSNGTTLPTQALTAVASIVSSASTQTASSEVAKTTPMATTKPTTLPSASSSIGATKSTPLAGTGMEIMSTPEETPGIMVAVLDWREPWIEFLNNLPADYYTISIDDLATSISTANPPFLLDVRDTTEVSQYGYIKGAVNIPYETVLKNLDKLPAPDQPIVVYSGVGHRGTIIMSALHLLGYSDVRVLDGGMTMWLKDKQPAESVPPAAPVAGTMPDIDPAKIADLESFIATGTYGITATDLNAKLSDVGKPIILDVRDPAEASATGAIEGSAHIPLKNLFDNLNLLPADKKSPIVVVDTTGHRGTIAMMALRMNGYSNARSLFGGMDAWLEAGLPVMK